MATKTNRFSLTMPESGETGWGDILNANALIIDEHLAGQMNELQDVDTTGKLDKYILQYSTTTSKWSPGDPLKLGIQTHAAFSDLSTDSHKIYLMLDGTLPMTADLNLNNYKIINIHTPEQDTDLTTKKYVDTIVGGVSFLPYVRSKGLLDPTGLTVANGDRFIVGTPTPINAWAGHANDIAVYISGAWSFIDAESGMTVWVDAENKYYTYQSSSWQIAEVFFNHNALINVNDPDAHPQYLNTARHGDIQLHEYGVNVPYPSIYAIAGTTIVNPQNNHILIYDAALTTWKNVAATSLGAKKHSDLDATSCEDVNCHPQYLTEADHTALLHSFVKLNDLSDVDTVSNALANKQMLYYYDPLGNNTGKWINAAVASLGISHHDLVNMGEPYDDHPQYYPISGSREIMGDLITKKDISFRSNTSLKLTFTHSLTGSDKELYFPNSAGMAMVSTSQSETGITIGSVPYYNGTGGWISIAPPSTVSASSIYAVCLNNTSKLPEWKTIPTFPSTGTKGDLLLYSGTSWVTLSGQVSNGSVLTSTLTGDVKWKTTAADFASLDATVTTQPTGSEVFALYDPVTSTYKKITHNTLFKRKRTIILNAGSALSDLASGGATMQLLSTGYSAPSYYYVEFAKSPSVPEHCQWLFTMPESWDGGSITAKIYWSTGDNSISGTVKWGVVGIRMGDGSALDSQFKTTISTYMAQAVNGAGANSLHITPEITLADITGSSGNLMCLSLTRGDTSTGDTISTSLRFLQLRLEYTVTSASD